MVVARSSATRKRHVQQALFRHGGKRKGAGRKPTHDRAGGSHAKRDDISGSDALHVVLRVVSEVGNLRRREIYQAVRAASRTAAGSAERRGRFRIVQLSIQHNHIHMLVEAESTADLACGMQGFKISAARNINTALRVGGRRRRGAVFADRYHLVVIRSPRHARHVLAYVLCNWRKHGEDRSGLPSIWLVDPFSSTVSFAGWKELAGQPPWKIRPGYHPLIVTAPRSWLLNVGWWRHGAISVREVPSQRVLQVARRQASPRATRP
ncbi:MAG: transposase [Kofleriaceae bacterium]